MLDDLMQCALFEPFRLVGGTALSLYLGHQMSVDIDLFTPADYGSLDFEAFDRYLKEHYRYVDHLDIAVIGMGKSYYVGNDKNDSVKLDLYYHDALIDEPKSIDGIRLATLNSIAAMKMDVVQRGGRRKDFYDLHELALSYRVEALFSLHETFFPYTHDRALLKAQLTNFSTADLDLEPECLRGKHWELIKLDFVEWVEAL